jgi:EmrB/QacA subfamily drug resistance transporter
MTLPTRGPCDDAAVLRGAAAQPCPASAKRWTLVAAIIGSSMAFIDGSVVNVGLPAIQRELGADAAQAQWIIESYALFLAALLLVGGALGDRFGRRLVFGLGVAIFSAASIACALSRNANELIAARAVQGIGAALLVPGSLSLISAVFPHAERGRAIGTWSAFSGVTAAAGPVIGGWLIDRWSWTWAFLVNLPLGVLLLALCWLKVPESRSHSAGEGIDTRGALWVTVGLAGVVYAFIQAPQRGWGSAEVLGALLAGVAGLALFVRAEARGAAPMLPLGLFRNADFSGANLLTLLLYAALGGGLYYLPLDLIQVQGYSATAAGAAMLPFIAIMFLLSSASGRLVDVFGARPLLVGGPVVAAGGFALFAWPAVGGSYWQTFFPAICLLGLGMAITVAPLTATVMNAVAADLAGVASGVNNAVSRVASLLAIAALGLLMAARFEAQLLASLSALQLPPDLLQVLVGQHQRLAGIEVPPGVDAATATAIREAIGTAFVSGFRGVMAVCTALALLGAASAALLIRSRAARG